MIGLGYIDIPGTSTIESGWIFSSWNIGLPSQLLQFTFLILFCFCNPVLSKFLPPITMLHLSFLEPSLICSKLWQVKVLSWNVTWTSSKQVNSFAPEWSILQSNFNAPESINSHTLVCLLIYAFPWLWIVGSY